MFELAEIGNRLSKEEYNAAVAELRPALLRLEHALRDRRDLAVAVLIGGVEGAGRSRTANLLTSWLDPRGVEVNAFGPDEESRGRPPFWRYWMHLPARGKIGVFFGSWYTDPIIQHVFNKMKKVEFVRELEKIRTFESHLCAENVLILKFWLHLSKKTQSRRLKAQREAETGRAALTRRDKEFLSHYDKFYEISEEALRVTSTGEAPWVVVEAEDRRWRSITVARHILQAVEERLAEPKPPKAHPMSIPAKKTRSVLDTVDLSQTIKKSNYEKRLTALQAEVRELGREAFERGVGTVAAFEGWDAAGKGGCIRRLVQGMDARNYRVVSIAAPTEEERVKPYLWRFWRALPPAGLTTVFDRSWYGRVLVERVEGFCRPEDWKRAFHEINDFEAQLTEAGYAVVKYWLHLSPEEQLRRFEERRETIYKQFKLTDEDWRNRDKWNAYLKACEEMFAATSTSLVPWTLVPAENKQIARLHVLEVFRDRLAEALQRSRKKRKSILLD